MVKVVGLAFVVIDPCRCMNLLRVSNSYRFLVSVFRVSISWGRWCCLLTTDFGLGDDLCGVSVTYTCLWWACCKDCDFVSLAINCLTIRSRVALTDAASSSTSVAVSVNAEGGEIWSSMLFNVDMFFELWLMSCWRCWLSAVLLCWEFGTMHLFGRTVRFLGVIDLLESGVIVLFSPISDRF